MERKGKFSNKNKMNGVEDDADMRRGPWTVDEDFKLINYIATHGEGRWNSLARSAGLKRTGKSCRLRWLNYLRPDVRRGNISLEEQLLILELHSRWGNRWSKIAQYLPGRTDNEIKNYWRTRVQKHAKQLRCDVNSKQFKDTMRYLWMPRLQERIQASTAKTTPTTATSSSPDIYMTSSYGVNDVIDMTGLIDHHTVPYGPSALIMNNQCGGYVTGNPNPNNYTTPDHSSVAVSPISDLTENHYNVPANIITDRSVIDSFQTGVDQTEFCSGNILNGPTTSEYYFNYDGFYDFQGMGQGNSVWFDGGDPSDSLRNADDQDFWYLQTQQHNDGSLL